MLSEALAYFITWTTYGSWLSGDERGWWVEGNPNAQLPNPQRAQTAARLMSDDAVVLNDEQRGLVDTAIRNLCQERGWLLHECNVRTNHVHVVVTANDREPEVVREQIKARGSKALSDHAGLPATASKNGRKKWWTEKGDIRRLWDEKSLEAAIVYVQNQ